MRLILLIFISLISIAASSQQQPNPIPSDQTADLQSQSAPTQPIEIRSDAINAIQQAVESIATNTVPDDQAEEENREIESNRLAELDLDAQQKMAKYTRLIYLATFAGLIVGIVTVIALGVTIYQTRAIIRQSRAWITPARKNILSSETQLIDGCPVITFEWINSGKSPAVKTRQRIGTTEMPKISAYENARISISDFPMGEWQMAGTIGSDQVVGQTLRVEDTALNSMRDPKTSTLVLIEIVYETIFDTNKHCSEALYEVNCVDGKAMFNIFPVGHNHRCT